MKTTLHTHSFRVLLLALLTAVAFSASAHDFVVDGIYYIKNGDEAIVTYNSSLNFTAPSYSGEVNIPETVTYNGTTYSVTAISNDAFSGCTGLTSVTIPNSVVNIGGGAFSGCSGLTSMTIPNSVKTISQQSFYSCTSLTDVTIPNSVTRIDAFAFYKCTSLQSVIIPNSVTFIGSHAFASCTNLASVNVPSSLTSMGANVFAYTAWYNNQPDGLIYFGPIAYRYKGTMPSGTSFVIDDGTLGIAGSAFGGCSGMTSVTIPNSVYFIGSNAFLNCTGLTNVTIPASVTDIGAYAFNDCTNLSTVTIKSDSVVSKDYSDSYNMKNIFGEQVNEYILGDGVKSVGAFAFSDSEVLYYVTFPNALTEIGYSAFANCTGLNSIIIPNSVKIIGDEAFNYCSNLQGVDMSNAVTYIGYHSFNSCSRLRSITIPNTIQTIGGGAFSSCTSLYEVHSRIKDVNSVTYNGSNIHFFYDVPILLSRLYVPVGTRISYLTHDVWRVFYNIIEEGDANGDGEVTAADVTAIYDYLLNNDSSGLVSGDVNNDGHINATDISAIYNILLGN